VQDKLGYTPVDPATLSDVATSGSYVDLTNKPTLSTVAASGSYVDLTNKPTLSTVAASGSYVDLTDKPTLGNLAALNTIAAAQISDGAVTAAKLGSNAVFFTQMTARTSQHSMSGDSGWQDHLTLTFTNNRTCNCMFYYVSSSAYESGPAQGFARFILNGSMIGYNSCVAKQTTANAAGGGSLIWDRQNLPAGTHTITVQLRNTVGGSTWITPYWGADSQTANLLGAIYYAG
jgi:hypothetical protein